MRSVFVAALIGSAVAQKGRQSSDPVYTCPAGFNLNGKICERQTTAQPQLICHQGVLSGLECLTETPKSTRCPPGTLQSGKQCITSQEFPPVKVCPTGFVETLAGCEAQQPLPLIEVCEIGSREGPECVTAETAPYVVSQKCPPGFEEAAKGGCWKKTTYDCTPAFAGKGGLRGLIGELGVAPANAKAQVIKQTCERKEAAPYLTDKVCPAGFEDNGINGCIKKHFHPVITKCSNGGAASQCFTTRTVPFEQECETGVMTGKMCRIQKTVAPETFCATGYDNGQACVQAHPTAPVCAPGLTLTGGLCVGSETAQPEVTVTLTCTGKNCHH
ncbi:putative oocyst wall protein [Gregarina niphandrodes]|uniref:Oocyst wall protein n=1 Tax=Gregarina niphandrodes TaxID=110365 RepID=A0A023AYS2_GRENI|nr:putative oocyst wall protein [Gregarina niphandrodes]EZG43817.1 putative oocyst wall protein [Gregarina niphandrodes]|eukprot:XP_011133001.1 putative oocyst wall protein [Gregarina niphandrodes]